MLEDNGVLDIPLLPMVSQLRDIHAFLGGRGELTFCEYPILSHSCWVI